MSGQALSADAPPDLAAVNGDVAGDAGVEHGALLVAFAEAVMRGDAGDVQRERDSLCAATSPETVVDVAAVIGAFNVVDRIADATGIPLDPFLAAASQEVRKELDLARFASSANSPEVG